MQLHSLPGETYRSSLDRFHKHPMASALLDELKTLATDVEKSKIDGAALATSNNAKKGDNDSTGRGGY